MAWTLFPDEPFFLMHYSWRNSKERRIGIAPEMQRQALGRTLILMVGATVINAPKRSWRRQFIFFLLVVDLLIEYPTGKREVESWDNLEYENQWEDSATTWLVDVFETRMYKRVLLHSRWISRTLPSWTWALFCVGSCMGILYRSILLWWLTYLVHNLE